MAHSFRKPGVHLSPDRFGVGDSGEGVSLGTGGGVPAYLGQVATRSFIPSRKAAFRYANSQSFHIAQDDIVSLQAVFAHWYVNAAGFAETAIGGNAIVSIGVEYPVGSGNRIQLALNETAVDGQNLVSTAKAIAIPRGGAFIIREYSDCASGFSYVGNTGFVWHPSDILEFSNSVLGDKTMGGTIVSGGAQLARFPAAIIATTRRRSTYVLGDSLELGGVSRSPNANGDTGLVSKSLGPLGRAYINGGVDADRLSYFTASNARRRELMSYASDIAIQMTRNDIGNQTEVQIKASHETIRGYFPDKRFYLVTTPPRTTSTDSFATAANQTVYNVGAEADKASLNTWKRGVPTGFAGCYDVAAPIQDAGNQAVWRSDGTPYKYVANDGTGTHATGFAEDAVVAASAVY